MLSDEVWKDIKGYEGLYQVSNLGQIRSLDRYKNTKGRYGIIKAKIKGRLLKPCLNHDGYEEIVLSKDGKSKMYRLHRIVAETFIDNVYNLPCVNHIDENKMNNRADNLEWCSIEYNNNYGNRNKKISINQRYANNKPIKCLETGQIFISLNECARKLNIKPPNIWASMNNYNRTKKAKGYTFKYIELEEIINERDKAEADLYEANNRINDLLDIVKLKDEIIDDMVEEYEYNARINLKNFCEDEMRKDKCIQDCKTCVRKYFEERCK